MTFLLAGLILMALAVFALTHIRRRSGEEEEAEGHALGATAILVVAALVVLFSGIATFGDALTVFIEMLPSWLKPWVGGAITGLAIYIASVFIFESCGRVFLWALKDSHKADETLGFWVRRHIYGSTATAFFLAIFWVVAAGVDNEAGVALMVALFAAVIHLFYPWVMPWFLYYRSQRLDPTKFKDVHHWLDEQARRRDMPKFYLRVQAGGMVNALASGGVYRHFVVLGQGLLERLSVEHIKAILAHELGHVLNRDLTRRILPAVGVSIVLHAVYLKEVTFAHMDTIPIFVTVPIGLVIFWYFLPLYFQRRREFDADRRAVELIGDAERVAQALEAFAEVTETPMDQTGWTHPPMRKRIEAIRKMGAERTSDESKS